MLPITKLQARRESLQRRLERLQNKQYVGDNLSASFHLGTVGASGRQSRRLNTRRAANLDRIIDDALEVPRLIAAIATIAAKIERRQNPPAPRPPKQVRTKREPSAREAAIREWYLYGGADDEPPEGLTDDELWSVRSRFC